MRKPTNKNNTTRRTAPVDDTHDGTSPDIANRTFARPGALLSFTVFLLALFGSFYAAQTISQDNPFAAIQAGPRVSVPLRGDEPQLGPDEALVTIVEFTDYGCRYCKTGAQPLLQALQRYEGQVRLIHKHKPLSGTNGATAAWAAAQQGAFWEVHASLFLDAGDLNKLAARHDLDVARFNSDRNSEAAIVAVEDDMRTASALGITGTPAFLVNGHHYQGSPNLEQWEQIVEAELDLVQEH
ncbi:MAG: DsbA family protein [Nannocystales bacterium]